MKVQFITYITLALLLNYQALSAQIPGTLVSGTLKNSGKVQVMSFQFFYKQILEHHPIVKQASLLNEMARQRLRQTRGEGFDPKLKSDFSRKEFKSKDYFNTWKTSLKVPLWIGAIEAGYERNNGIFLNPENSLPSNGLGFLGISVPLGRGIVTNTRRATLRQAKTFIEIAEADRRAMVNQILLEATQTYWSWYLAHRKLELIKDGYNLASVRYKAVKQRVKMGELAGIDSVKAKIILQKRLYELQDVYTKSNNARIKLSNYLWQKDNIPLEVSGNLIPSDNVPINTPKLGDLLDQAAQNHPELLSLNLTQKNLRVEERLQRDELKPRVDLKYQILTNPVGNNQDKAVPVAFQENYKVGLKFEFPLFLRKARGKIQQVRIKKNQTELKLTQKQREVRNKVISYFNEFTNLQRLIQVQRQMVESYDLLRTGELKKFSVGESDLFLVNTRENQLLESRVKLASLEAKFRKYYAKLRWAAGLAPIE
ncbi:TolC family protein [Microscilla marina]|nr:TolC family protein [Microscilla marina]